MRASADNEQQQNGDGAQGRVSDGQLAHVQAAIAEIQRKEAAKNEEEIKRLESERVEAKRLKYEATKRPLSRSTVNLAAIINNKHTVQISGSPLQVTSTVITGTITKWASESRKGSSAVRESACALQYDTRLRWRRGSRALMRTGAGHGAGVAPAPAPFRLFVE